MDVQLPIEAKDIQKLIPHRYPFLQLDRITAFEPMKTLTAIKNVTMNEPQFQAMAQACGTLAILSEGGRKENEFFFFAGIDEARFKRQVIPGDQLVFEVELLTSRRGIGKFNAVAKVDGQVAVEAVIMCAKRVV